MNILKNVGYWLCLILAIMNASFGASDVDPYVAAMLVISAMYQLNEQNND